jgi:hypothetical protein
MSRRSASGSNAASPANTSGRSGFAPLTKVLVTLGVSVTVLGVGWPVGPAPIFL